MSDSYCPVCGYYCLGNGGFGCIDKTRDIKMRKQILCLDFDGVLHSYASGWKGANIIPDPPTLGSREFLSEAIVNFDVYIYSSRSHQKGGRKAMKKWCEKHFGEWITKKITFPKYKPSASVSIDDRAIMFTGKWPPIPFLKDFRPWNKKPGPKSVDKNP